MAILKPTKITGRVAWLGLVANREDGLASGATKRIHFSYEGPVGDSHAGLTRQSCTRTRLQYPVGTETRNARQFSIVSLEELTLIAQAMGVPEVKPEWLGATVALQGLPQLTVVPPASRLIFDNGASLVIDMENSPCRHPAELLETIYPGKGMSFPKTALGLRGVVGWVERPGEIEVGERAVLHTPPQRLYKPAL